MEEGEAQVRVPFSGQHWGQLKTHGGVRGWTLAAAAEPRDEQVPSFIEAEFEGVAPHVHVNGSSVEVGYARWAWASWGRTPRAHVGLSTKLPWSIVLSGGVSRLHALLDDLKLSGLSIQGGVSDLLLELSEPNGPVPIRIHGGVERLTIVRPPTAGIALRVTGGASDVRLDETFLQSVGGQLVWQADLERTQGHYDVHITGGVSRLIVARSTPPLCTPAGEREVAQNAALLVSCAV